MRSEAKVINFEEAVRNLERREIPVVLPKGDKRKIAQFLFELLDSGDQHLDLDSSLRDLDMRFRGALVRGRDVSVSRTNIEEIKAAYFEPENHDYHQKGLKKAIDKLDEKFVKAGGKPASS